jgi:hypothetical protein
MSGFVWLLIIGTSIWVFTDARRLGVRRGHVKGFLDMGPGGWLAACLLLWLVAFPAYLAMRGEYKLISQGGTTTAGTAPAPAPSNNVWRNIAVAFGIVFLIGVVGGIAKRADHNPAASGAGQPAQQQAEQDSRLTLAKFNAVRAGMTYQQACQVLGSEGQELSRSEFAGHTTVMYKWDGWIGTNMNAMFQNGKLISKAQFGLR